MNKDIDWVNREMEKFSIEWHIKGKCNCMVNSRKEINGDSYVPCEHLKESLWKEFHVTINSIWNEAQDKMSEKLNLALRGNNNDNM